MFIDSRKISWQFSIIFLKLFLLILNLIMEGNMFLIQHKNGYYKLCYNNNFGRRITISTKSKNKSGALQFLSGLSKENCTIS